MHQKKRRNGVMQTRQNDNVSAAHILVKDFTVSVKNKENNDASIVTPSDKVKRSKRIKTAQLKLDEATNCNDFPISKLSPPENNRQYYTKPEAVNLLVAYMKSSTFSRYKIIKAMKAAKYIPCSEKTMENLHNKFLKNEAIPDTEWTAGGRPRLVPKAVVDAKVKELKAYGNEGKDLNTYVKDMIMDNVAKEKDDAGFIADVEEPDQGTIDKYVCEMIDKGVAIVDKVVSKTETRGTSEKSERCSVSNVAAVGYAHFETMEEEDKEMFEELKHASLRTKALYELVRRARGGAPIWAIRPELIFSSDDTTTYIFDGKKGKKGKWIAASDVAVKNRGTSSVYLEEKTNQMNGMRVKNTFTYSAGGKTAPLFVTVSGLSDEEMPNDDFIHLKVPGLGINGKGVTVGNNLPVGHVFFMKKSKGADEQRVKTYQDEVLLKYIDAVRKDIDGNFSYIPGNVPIKMKAVSWMDGDLAQIASVVDNVDEFAKMGVTVCKQNAARTGVEQPADLAPVFKLFKKYVEEMTASDNPDTKRFRQELTKAFNSEELSGLKLSYNNKNALLDFLAIMSAAATKACTPENVMKGFYESGIIDRETNRFPVLFKILAQCKKEIKKDVVEKIVEDFPSLLQAVDTEGRVPESWFNDHGYAMDVNSKGEEVSRPDSITREHMQRSKVMTHPYQGQLRLANIQRKIAERRAKLVRGNDSYNRQLAAVQNAVTKLCKLAGRDVSESNLTYCTEANFRQVRGKGSRGVGLTNPDLLAFVWAHDDTLKMKKDMEGWKRDELERRAFDTRERPNRLLLQGPPNDLEKFDDETSLTNNARIPRRVRVVNIFDQSSTVTASKLLSNVGWVERLLKLFDMDKFALLPEFDRIGDEEKQNADTLTALLRVRLNNHVNSRIKNETDRKDRIWDWADKNLPVCAAYMIIAGHVTSNFQTVPEGGSLLQAGSNTFIPHERFKNRHGVYLQHDRKLGEIVRSGKKTSVGNAVKGFGARIEEHKCGCKANRPTSNFYSLYPSKSIARSKTDSIQGVFEDLDHVIAAGFEPKEDAAQIVNLNWDDGGILILNQEEKRQITACIPNKPHTEIEKFQMLMSYLFEVAYDVSIAPSLNVSESPGFESLSMSRKLD